MLTSDREQQNWKRTREREKNNKQTMDLNVAHKSAELRQFLAPFKAGRSFHYNNNKAKGKTTTNWLTSHEIAFLVLGFSSWRWQFVKAFHRKFFTDLNSEPQLVGCLGARRPFASCSGKIVDLSLAHLLALISSCAHRFMHERPLVCLLLQHANMNMTTSCMPHTHSPLCSAAAAAAAAASSACYATQAMHFLFAALASFLLASFSIVFSTTIFCLHKHFAFTIVSFSFFFYIFFTPWLCIYLLWQSSSSVASRGRWWCLALAPLTRAIINLKCFGILVAAEA